VINPRYPPRVVGLSRVRAQHHAGPACRCRRRLGEGRRRIPPRRRRRRRPRRETVGIIRAG
jgi:hypothetical protein